MRRLPALTATAALAAATLVLTACTDASQQPSGGSTGASDDASASAPRFDPSTVEVDEDIAALLPEEIAEQGTLVVGSNTEYAPAEFIDADGKTPVGFDIDTIHAVAAVLGLEAEIESAQFDGIIPAIGSKYDVGISSFTITDERTAEANMISYAVAGSQYGVAAGNPEDFDPENLCGATIGVQTSTIQDEELTEATEECEADGEEAIDVVRYDSQADVTTNLVGGKLQAMYADSPITAYASEQTDGAVESVGEIVDAAPYGIVVAQDDDELTEAVQAAVQKLIDDGTLADVFAAWGSADPVVEEAELNPAE
ncbi:ABC transporter substrate-binding protein [Promicromonospora thailandica]|uniref:Polar amino acid transport system substrate-binding protein n=1 Tax=Promicromonospora thailandica TaxID=765201 RepID=A0A9X2G415_9MICO|nr:ABC transporter substrate-binding protein [Promicromonospora thailandica]MCP2265138.1 polar amino acid transport system substrate-binding protein [Promicromonospora thailandica]BFF19790.1 ABC transporter substrate-binding protein [Promicromonospora thailandica]